MIGYQLSARADGRKKLQISEKKVWKVVMVQAQKTHTSAYDYSTSGAPVEGEVSVRIVRGKEFLTMGTIKIKAEDFEARADKLLEDARQRADLLNAYMDEYA